jgi:hypothetical protein
MYLEKSAKTPAPYGDPAALQQARLHCKALTRTALFDAQPTPQTKKDAMDSWNEIKLLLRTLPDHQLFRKADEEIRRIESAKVEVDR